MSALIDLVKFYTTSVGTGAIIIGDPVPGFLTPAGAGCVDGKTYSYIIRNVAGDQRETGRGAYNAGAGSIARGRIQSTSGTPVVLAAGDVIGIGPIVEDFDDIGSHSALFTASEALNAGDLINLFGAAQCRKANATDNTKPADGFVKAVVAMGDTARVYFSGQINDAVAGLAAGTRYFLSTVGGAVTAVAPAAAGNIDQEIGPARSATELLFQPKQAFTR